MTQSNIDAENSPQSNAAFQLLALVLSVGTHYIVASNLGLFSKLNPVKPLPVGGTVKAVNLNPSEQSRIPEAAKAKPLAIDLTQPVVVPATRATSSGPNPGVFFGNTPKINNRPTPQASANQNSQPNKPSTLPKPSNTIKKDDSRYKLDRNNKFPGIITKPGDSGVQNQSVTPRGTKRTNDEQPGITSPDQQTTSGDQPVDPKKKEPKKKEPLQQNTKAKVNRELQEKIRGLQKRIGKSRIDSSIVPTQTSYDDMKCSRDREEDGIIIISIILNNQSELIDIINVYSPFIEKPSNPDTQKPNASNIKMRGLVAKANELAQERHSKRTEEQKKKDEGISVIYTIPFEIVKESCN